MSSALGYIPGFVIAGVTIICLLIIWDDRISVSTTDFIYNLALTIGLVIPGVILFLYLAGYVQ